MNCSSHISGTMKVFVAVLLLVACAKAIDISKLKPVEIRSPPLFPKYTGAEWDEIKKSQILPPVAYPGFRPGAKPQPATAGLSLKHPDSRIVGGKIASHGQFPWQAFINMDNSYVCGGSLISKEWILSAGHCAADFSTFVVVLGAQNIPSTGEEGRKQFTSEEKIVHESYDPYNIKNDISLIRLPMEVQISPYINLVKLPSYSMASNDFVGKKVTVSGWGKYSDHINNISPDLRYVTMVVMSNDECANYFGGDITSSNICTDTTGGHSACNGDSGGPLVIQGSDGKSVEVGIVSFGSSEGCEKDYPAVFTRVTSFLQWIESKTGIAIDP